MALISRLSYLGFNVKDFDNWSDIVFKVLGLECRVDSPSGQYKFRMDDQHHRFSFIESDENSVAFVGWEVDTRDDFIELQQHLESMGVEVSAGTAEEIEDRQVLDLIKFNGPDGVPLEVCLAPFKDNHPFQPSCKKFGGFKTDGMGLGHILYCHSDPEQAIKFYCDAFGMRISDYIHWDEAKATFLHCNTRHHSLAVCNPCFGDGPGDLNHFMLEAENIDDVGQAYDRVNELGVPLVLTLGKHTNDKMTSFYMITPSGFAIEYGYGGEEIHDDSQWHVELYNAPKIWGHQLVK